MDPGDAAGGRVGCDARLGRAPGIARRVYYSVAKEPAREMTRQPLFYHTPYCLSSKIFADYP